MLGPTIGGLVLSNFGIAGAFSISVACYALAVISALRIRHRNNIAPFVKGAMFAHIIEGLLLARRDKRLVAILVITVTYNVFGWPFTSMIPVIGQDHLGLGAAGIGLLASLDGIGAFCGAVVIALFAKPPIFARLYLGGVFAYLMMLPIFAFAPNPLLAGTVLLVTGLANAGFSIMQATLVYLAAPPEMRSRIYGVLSVCIGVGMIGFINLGLLAGLIGASWATAMIGVEGIAAMLLTRRWWRAIAA
jgi:MFS family permease